MELDQIIVTIVGILSSVWVAWFFWFSERKATHVTSSNSNVQEAMIKVKGGYSPDIIVVQAGKPVRLNFHREETALCSEQVLFSDFNKQATLTPFTTVPVEFTPDVPGEYEFQCAMGMLRGKLIVEQ
ncbi:MAG: cupredoxin domain-containing protein [Calditrichaeota bacterium]|nr:MAG: cupredoxin domain-containing protein [Calditrichota bacterium]MBL1207235.1 cupredoxin domain-containing protein [Calditrichota bacterium]NOG47068.1 cupredoxin domain-containing protein [Calditrichota bacterium]